MKIVSDCLIRVHKYLVKLCNIVLEHKLLFYFFYTLLLARHGKDFLIWFHATIHLAPYTQQFNSIRTVYPWQFSKFILSIFKYLKIL